MSGLDYWCMLYFDWFIFLAGLLFPVSVGVCSTAASDGVGFSFHETDVIYSSVRGGAGVGWINRKAGTCCACALFIRWMEVLDDSGGFKASWKTTKLEATDGVRVAGTKNRAHMHRSVHLHHMGVTWAHRSNGLCFHVRGSCSIVDLFVTFLGVACVWMGTLSSFCSRFVCSSMMDYLSTTYHTGIICITNVVEN